MSCTGLPAPVRVCACACVCVRVCNQSGRRTWMTSIQRVVDRSNRVAEHEQRGRMAGPGTATWYAEELATVPEFNMKDQEVLLAELIRALQPADPNFLEVFVATDGTFRLHCAQHNNYIC